VTAGSAVPPDAVPPDAAFPGIGTPDARGRTNLHTTGLELSRNPRVRVRGVELLSSDWYILRKTTFDYQGTDGEWSSQTRETYDRGDGAAILLYNVERRSVLLVRQFRYPAYVNGHESGYLDEVPAGLLDDDEPGVAIRREASEETGVELGDVHELFDLFMSPGSITERIHYFAAEYDAGAASGLAGIAAEGEDIELIEYEIDDAIDAIGTRIVDGKTALLLYWAVTRGPFASR